MTLRRFGWALTVMIIGALVSDHAASESQPLFTTPGAPGWWALPNPWNAGNLVNHRDYNQTITINPARFPNGTVLSWRWPDRSNSHNVWGYPEVAYGYQAGVLPPPDSKGPRAVQIRHLAVLTGSYEIAISGDTDEFDVLWETQLTSAPHQGQIFEFSVLIHAPSYIRAWFADLPRKHRYESAEFAATIAVTDNGSYPYILVLPDRGDLFSGTFDLKALFDFLIAKKVLTGNEYVQGFELGAEPRKKSGTLKINLLSYDWNGTVVPSEMAARSAAPTHRKQR